MSHRALVIGATGAVGSRLVRELLSAPSWESVHILIRRPEHPFAAAPGAEKLRVQVVDMERIEAETTRAAEDADCAFSCMGIGQPRKVSREEVWKVEVMQTIAYARACKAAGVSHFSLLSSVGADSASRSYYLHTKGAVEDALQVIGFSRTSFFHPSLLVTKEMRYGLQDRLTQSIFPRLSWLLPRRLHQIRVEDVARAMRINAEEPASDQTVEVLSYDDMINLVRAEAPAA